jgi:hypothetical protein
VPQAELKTGKIMRTRIPKLIAEINTIIADHSDSDSEEEYVERPYSRANRSCRNPMQNKLPMNTTPGDAWLQGNFSLSA